tara:strand:- start:93 stop:737 length:645 start_codon:yes stop_codon:yes gene_type:complete
MKKITSILFASIIFTTSAFAGGLVGLKVGIGELEATRGEIVNTPATLNEAADTKDIDHEYGAIYAEVNLNDSPVNAGLEFVPITGTISVATDNTDASAEVGNLATAYLLAAKEVANGGSVYAKLGYSQADIDNAKQSNGGTTINSFSDSLEGPMVGVGFQSAANSLGLVFRAEATHTEFDDVSVNTTDTDGLVETKRASDITFQTITISIAKTF